MTNLFDLPYDFKVGNKSSADGDRPTFIFNPQNDRLLFDEDGAGGDKAIKVGRIDKPGDLTIAQVAGADIVFGSRSSNIGDGPTVILNLKNGNLLFDEDGAGGASATRFGHIDLDLIV